ncbi:MAG: hypothetical protein ACLTK8_01845 [Paeniclostridium sp.]
MGAIVLNGAEIGEFCMIGAGALVTQTKSSRWYAYNRISCKSCERINRRRKQSLIKSADDYCANAQKHK